MLSTLRINFCLAVVADIAKNANKYKIKVKPAVKLFRIQLTYQILQLYSMKGFVR